MPSIKNDPEKVKKFWQHVDQLVEGLPKEAADVIRAGAQEMLDADGKVDVDELSARVTPDFAKIMENQKPIRSMKLTPRLAKKVKEDMAWLKEQKAKAEKLKAKKDAIEAEAEKLLSVAKDRKDALDALCIVEMGISRRKNVYRINDKTMELEVMYETKLDL